MRLASSLTLGNFTDKKVKMTYTPTVSAQCVGYTGTPQIHLQLYDVNVALSLLFSSDW